MKDESKIETPQRPAVVVWFRLILGWLLILLALFFGFSFLYSLIQVGKGAVVAINSETLSRGAGIQLLTSIGFGILRVYLCYAVFCWSRHFTRRDSVEYV